MLILLSFTINTLLINLDSFDYLNNIKLKITEIKRTYLIAEYHFKKYFISIYELNEKDRDSLILNQKILLNGSLKDIVFKNNYYEFDFQKFLNEKHIFKEVKINNYQLINDGLLYNLNKFYNKFLNNEFSQIFIKSNHDKDFKLIEAMNKLSVTYLLNFSGLNIFILSLMINYICKKIFKIKYKRIIIFLMILDGVILIFLYTINFPFIMTKSFIFLIIKNIFKYKNVKVSKLNIWLLSFSILIAFNNSIIFSPAFIYYLIGLMFIKNNKHLTFKMKVIKDLILCTLTFGIVNIILEYRFMYFNEIYDLLLSPIIALINIFVIFTFYIPNINYSYEWISNSLIKYINLLQITNLFYAVGFISIWWYLSYFLILYLAISFYKFINWKSWILLIGLILIILLIIFTKNKIFTNNYFELLNVGNGQCLFLRMENKVMLFDCGVGTGHNKSLIFSYLNYHGIKNVDYLFLSHQHADHYNGIEFLNKENISIKKIIIKENSQNEFFIKNIKINIFNRGANFKNENNNSLVINVNINSKNFLIMGDLEKEGENELLNEEGFKNFIYNNHIDYYVIGHHGSKTSTSYNFIKQILPEKVLISGEDRGNRHFPNAKTIQTLSDLNIEYELTAYDKNIIIKI